MNVRFFVDLDETLIASGQGVTQADTPMILRPGAHAFLATLGAYGAVYLYTASLPEHANDALARFDLAQFFDGAFYRGDPVPRKMTNGMNFLFDDQALTREDIVEQDPSESWMTKSTPFKGNLTPIYVAPFEIHGRDKRPNLQDALRAVTVLLSQTFEDA